MGKGALRRLDRSFVQGGTTDWSENKERSDDGLSHNGHSSQVLEDLTWPCVSHAAVVVLLHTVPLPLPPLSTYWGMSLRILKSRSAKLVVQIRMCHLLNLQRTTVRVL